MKTMTKRCGMLLLSLLLLFSAAAPAMTSADEGTPPAYGADTFAQMDIVDDCSSGKDLLSVKYSDGMTYAAMSNGDTALFFAEATYALQNELTWEIRPEARVALSAYYYHGQIADGAPTAENMPTFFVSEDRVSWTPVAQTKAEYVEWLPYQDKIIHWIDSTPVGARYLKVSFSATGITAFGDLRMSGGTGKVKYETVFEDGAGATALCRAYATSGDVYGKDNDYVGQLERADMTEDGHNNVLATYWPAEASHSFAAYNGIAPGGKVIAEAYIHSMIWGRNAAGLTEPGKLRDDVGGRFFRLSTSADGQNWTVAEDTQIAVYPGPRGTAENGQYPIRAWDKVILGLEAMPEGHTYLRVELPSYKDVPDLAGATWMMFVQSVRVQTEIPAEETVTEDAEALAAFDALTSVDEFDDVSRIAGVLYKDGFTVTPAAEQAVRTRAGDAVLSFAEATYAHKNEMSWAFSAGQQPVLGLYYPKALLDEDGTVPQQLRPVFYTSGDRFTWTKLDTADVQTLGSYIGQKLLAFRGAAAPHGTAYLKVVWQTGSRISFSALRAAGTADGTPAYDRVFEDPMDYGIRPADKCDVIFFNEEYGLFTAGQGEVKDFRRTDGKMGVLRTYWPEDKDKELWVDYKVPLGSRVTVEAYLQNIVWKRGEDGVVLSGELADEVKALGKFKLYTSADGKTWAPAEAVEAVYPGFGQVDGHWVARDFDKLVYGIEQMPQGHSLVRIVLPNYLSAEEINGVRIRKDPENPDTTYDWIWIPSLKSVRADLPASGLPEAEPVDEGNLADLPVLDPCDDLSLAEPTSYENIRVQQPNGVSFGQTDPGDAALVRLHGDVQTALSWRVGAQAKVAVIAYQHASTLDGDGVRADAALTLLTGQDRFTLKAAAPQVRVLGRVGQSEYYKVAYVIDRVPDYDTVLRAVFPKTAKATDIAVAAVRATAGVQQTDPQWKTTFHDTCADDTYVDSFEGGTQFVYDVVVRDGIFANDGTCLPDGDLERVFPVAARMDNAIVWKVAPGSRVTFKVGYMSYMFANDKNGLTDYTALTADRTAAGHEFMPKLYTSADNMIWDEVENFRFEFVPTYHIDEKAGISAHGFDFGYFRIDVPNDAHYAIFEFPGMYAHNWEIKLHDVLAEEPVGGIVPDVPEKPDVPDDGGKGTDEAPATGVRLPALLPVAAAAAAALIAALAAAKRRRAR